MSVWQCETCGTLRAPDPGPCPKCGGATQHWSNSQSVQDVVVTSTKYWLSASPVPQEDWQRRWSQVDQMLASRNMELADERAKLRAAEEHVYKLQQELRVRTEHPVTTLIGDSRPLKFSLLTDEYCSMVGSRESEYTTTSRPLISKTFVAALHEAEALFVRLDRYEVQVWDKSRQMYPQNPRLVAQMEVE